MNDGFMVNAINNFMDQKSTGVILGPLLENIMCRSGCIYGLIGETRYTDRKQPYTRFVSVNGFPPDSPYTKNMLCDGYIDFMQPGTLHSEVYTTKQIVICNDIPVHRKGRPIGSNHPEMKNFCLIPLVINNAIIGVVGLSGYKGEMSLDWVSTFESELHIIKAVLILILQRRAIESKEIQFLEHIFTEMKTPLNGIISMSEMLRDSSLDKEQLELLDLISHCNIQLLEIINDIGDYTKVTTGKLQINHRTFSLKSVVKAIVQALSSKSKGVKITYKYTSDIDMITSDEVRITQILLNILNNSIEHTSKGHITLLVETVAYSKEAAIMKFVISDTGEGISSDLLPYVFDRTSKPSASRVGLGLPITKKLVELFSGNININSTVNVGTVVTFTLKFTEQTCDTAKIKGYCKGRHILLVADDPKVKKELFDLSTSWGLKPVICNSEETVLYLSGRIFTFIGVLILNSTNLKFSAIKGYEGATAIRSDNNKINFDYVYPTSYSTKQCLDAFLEHIYVSNNTISDSEDQDHIKILIATSSVETQQSITTDLNHMGYFNIASVTDGLELYMKLQDSYTVAFTDIELPVMDCFTVLEKIQGILPNNKVIVIGIVPSITETIRNNCYRVGMSGYIAKPIKAEEVKSTMNAIVRKKISDI